MSEKAKVGLALEGGAMRGLFSAGILDVLLEAGVGFDAIVGVSAGAAFGCNFKSGQAGRALRYNTRYCRDKRYCSLWSLVTTGDLYGADFCYRALPQELDPFDWKSYRANPTKFYAVCTNVRTGKPAYFLCDGEKERVLEIYRASASMPLVSRMVAIDGEKYLDGGMSDSIPLDFLEKGGYEKNVVILTQPRDYVKGKNGALPLVRAVYRKYPALVQAMAQRHKVYNAQTKKVFQREKEGKAFVFAPAATLPVSRTEKDPEKLKAAYDEGRKTALARLSELQTFLTKE